MARFNKKREIKKTVNLAGGKAFSMKAEEELLHAVLTSFLDDKYYETAADRQERLGKLIAQCDPEYVAKLAIVARKEFHMRSTTHVLLGELALHHKGDSIVKNAIYHAAIRVDDLLEIVSYVGTPLPKQVKRGVRHALLKFNRYQLAKYRGDDKGVSLVDLFNLTHPNPEFANKEQKKAWKDLMEGKLKNTDTWEAKVSEAEGDEEDTKEAWIDLIKKDKLGYMALLRNLNNLLKSDVPEAIIDKAVRKLTDPEEIKKSKQLPFRFVSAFEAVKGSRVLSDAISRAMDIAVSNVPELKGRILIALDSSGSMAEKAMPIASIFAATLVKANMNADLVLFSDKITEINIISGAPVIGIANDLKNQVGGGTNTSLVFHYAAHKKKLYDRIIIISDNQSWADYDSPQSTYALYKKALSTDPYIYAIDIQGYGSKDISGNKVFHLTGWSDRLLDFIGKAEDESLLSYIKNYPVDLHYNLPAPKKVKKTVKKTVKKKVKKVVKKSKKKSHGR